MTHRNVLRDHAGRFAPARRATPPTPPPTRVNPPPPPLPTTVPQLPTIRDAAERMYEKIFADVALHDRLEHAAREDNTLIIQAVLSCDKHPDVRAMLAKNPHTNPDTLRTLQQDTDTGVLASLAHNNNTPTDVLYHLNAQCHANPKLWAVACALLTHPHLPVTIARSWEHHPDPTIQRHLRQAHLTLR